MAFASPLRISSRNVSMSQYRCPASSTSGVGKRCTSVIAIVAPSSVPTTARPLDAPRSNARKLGGNPPDLGSLGAILQAARRLIGRGGTLGRVLLPVARRAEGAHRVERRPGAAPRLRDDRTDVSLVCLLQGSLGHEHVTRFLVADERRLIDELRLRVRELQLIDRLEHRLDGILEVVALVDHIRGMEIGEPLALGQHQFVKDQKQRIWLDRASREVIVTILGVVEVESAELTDAEQPRDDELDIGVRQVVAQIDETLRATSERLRQNE